MAAIMTDGTPEQSPIYWLRRASLAIRKTMDEELHSHELSGAQFEVLRQLLREDGLEQRTLQERLGVSSPTLTGVVDGMVERGMLERRASLSDARVKCLYLTCAGRDTDAAVHQTLLRMEQRLLADFSPAEVVLLREWLRRIVLSLDSGDAACH